MSASLALALDAAAALEEALRAWTPGERDFDVQARVAERLERVGAFGACLIVGGDDRVERFRHPLAAGVPMTRLVMAVVVAERGGLHAAATRFACAGELSPGVRAARAAALAVEAATLAACVPGATYGDVLRALDRAYAEAGHPGAWAEHYQGGPSATASASSRSCRRRRTAAGSRVALAEGHAVAWNPSVAGGGKAEDTYLVEPRRPAPAHRHRRVAAVARRPSGRARRLDGRRRREGRRTRSSGSRGRRATQRVDVSRTAPHFRIEIPSVEGPRVLEEVVERRRQRRASSSTASRRAAARCCCASRSCARWLRSARSAGIEVSLFVGPREGFDVGAHARTPDGSAHFGQLRGLRGLALRAPRTSRARSSAGSAAS